MSKANKGSLRRLVGLEQCPLCRIEPGWWRSGVCRGCGGQGTRKAYIARLLNKSDRGRSNTVRRERGR